MKINKASVQCTVTEAEELAHTCVLELNAPFGLGPISVYTLGAKLLPIEATGVLTISYRCPWAKYIAITMIFLRPNK